MTLSDRIKELEESVKRLTAINRNLLQSLIDLKGFMVESQLSMAQNMQDLHNRLNYIKTYIGTDEFFKALRDDSNHTSA